MTVCVFSHPDRTQSSPQQIKILTILGSDEGFQIPEIHPNVCERAYKHMLGVANVDTEPPLRTMMATGQRPSRRTTADSGGWWRRQGPAPGQAKARMDFQG